MPIDETQVRQLERLAALRLEDAERARLAGHLARVIAYVEQLQQLDTTGSSPCAHAVEIAAPRRDDVPRPSLPRAEAIAGSPAKDRTFFVVPAVFGPRGDPVGTPGEGEAGADG